MNNRSLNRFSPWAAFSAACLIGVATIGCGEQTAERATDYGPAPKSDVAAVEGDGGGESEQKSEPVAAPPG